MNSIDQLKKSLYFNAQSNMFKLARYISVVIKNSQKIDQVKALLFHQGFSINQLFKQLDYLNKGFIDTNDLFRILQKHGADKKVIQIQKIFRYFVTINNRIYKNQFAKAIALPSWKINISYSIIKQNKRQAIMFKFLTTLYMAIEEDDTQRDKLKDIDMQTIFNVLSKNGDLIGIDGLQQLLVDKKFPKPDSFGLLRFMHNRLCVNASQFSGLFRNILPEKFQQIDGEVKILQGQVSSSSKYLKKNSNNSEKTSETNKQFSNNLLDLSKRSVIVEKKFSSSNIFGNFTSNSAFKLQDFLKKTTHAKVDISFCQ